MERAVLSSRENVVPARPEASSSFPTRSCAAFIETRRARNSSVSASHSATMGWLGVPKGEAEVVGHGGHQEAAHDAADHEGGMRGPKRRPDTQPAASDARGGLPPRVVRQVAAERGAHGGSHLPIKGSQQVLIEQVPFDAHVTALPGENHLGGSVINTDDRRADGAHRKLAPGPRVDVLTEAKSRPQRRGARVRTSMVSRTYDVSHHKLRPAPLADNADEWSSDVAMRRASSGGP